MSAGVTRSVFTEPKLNARLLMAVLVVCVILPVALLLESASSACADKNRLAARR